MTIRIERVPQLLTSELWQHGIFTEHVVFVITLQASLCEFSCLKVSILAGSLSYDFKSVTSYQSC